MAIDHAVGTMVAASTAAFSAYFLAIKYTTELNSKRLAWVLPAASSIILGTLSLYEVYRLAHADFDFNSIAFTDSSVSRLATSIFLGSLIADCVLGSIFYLQHFDPVSGWCHHVFYIMATLYAIHGGFTSGMISFFPNEFPTFVLALGHVVPELRSDIGFGLTFFSTRILYHAWLTYKTITFKQPPFEVRGCVLLPMLLHVWWFSNWCKGQVRRMAKARRLESDKKAA